MKKLVSLLLVAIMLLTFVSCSQQKNEGESQQPITQNSPTPKATQSVQHNTAAPTSEQNTVVPTVEPTAVEDKHLELVTASSLDAFHEGLAWVHFRKVSRDFYANGDVSEKTYEDYVGCIDKTGKIVFYFPGKSSKWTGFSIGVAYWENNGTLYLIDKTGKVLSQHSTNESSEEHAIKWADGYVLTFEKVASFSENKDIYRVYNANGEKINALQCPPKEHDWQYNWEYCGKGIFYYRLNNYSGYGMHNFYMDSNGNTFDDEDKKYSKGDSYEPIFLSQTTRIAGVKFDDCYGVELMDTEFNFRGLKLPDFNYSIPKGGTVSEDHLFLHESTWDGYVAMSIDIPNMKKHLMDDTYVNRVKKFSLMNLTDGRYAFDMKGADEKQYVGLFDAELNIVCDPILGEFYGFSCGRLFVRRINHGSYCVYVYDKDGNELFTINSDKSSHLGYFGYVGTYASEEEMNRLTLLYSDDVLLAGKFGAVPEISDDGEIVNREGFKGIYLDLDGNILFESIDFSTGVEISIE